MLSDRLPSIAQGEQAGEGESKARGKETGSAPATKQDQWFSALLNVRTKNHLEELLNILVPQPHRALLNQNLWGWSGPR